MEEFTIIEILGKNMHNARYKKRMTLSELAKLTDIDLETLRKFESGEQVGLTVLHYTKITNALGANLEELFAGIDIVKD